MVINHFILLNKNKNALFEESAARIIMTQDLYLGIFVDNVYSTSSLNFYELQKLFHISCNEKS